MANFRGAEEDILAKETQRMVREIRVGITGPRNRTEKHKSKVPERSNPILSRQFLHKNFEGAGDLSSGTSEKFQKQKPDYNGLENGSL